MSATEAQFWRLCGCRVAKAPTPPLCAPNAPPISPQCGPNASTMRPQCVPKASPMRSQSAPASNVVKKRRNRSNVTQCTPKRPQSSQAPHTPTKFNENLGQARVLATLALPSAAHTDDVRWNSCSRSGSSIPGLSKCPTHRQSSMKIVLSLGFQQPQTCQVPHTPTPFGGIRALARVSTTLGHQRG